MFSYHSSTQKINIGSTEYCFLILSSKIIFLCQFLILKKLSKRTSQMEILFPVLANPSSWCRQCITLFRNGSTGYLLISDYTIKINFLHEISIQKKLSKCSTQLETLHWQTHFSPSKHIYIWEKLWIQAVFSECFALTHKRKNMLSSTDI